MQRPNFLGVGGVKCGSTWLSECLRDHPQIFLSSPKELSYFGGKFADRSIDWYLSHFEGSEGFKAVGEFSPGYLMHAGTAERIRDSLGIIRTIVILRDPVRQFVSHFKMWVKNGRFARTDQLDMTVLDRVATEKLSLLTHGKCHDNLKKYFEVFGEDNVFVLINEEARKDPRRALASVYGYLGVDTEFEPYSLTRSVSPGIIPRFQFLEKFRRNVYLYLAENRPGAIDRIRKAGVAELYRKLNNRGDIGVSSEVLEYLSDYYREDVLKLEKLLDRDLTCWTAGERSMGDGREPV
jgi:hypothetical protein